MIDAGARGDVDEGNARPRRRRWRRRSGSCARRRSASMEGRDPSQPGRAAGWRVRSSGCRWSTRAPRSRVHRRRATLPTPLLATTENPMDRSFDYTQKILLAVEIAAAPRPLTDMPPGYTVFQRLDIAEVERAFDESENLFARLPRRPQVPPGGEPAHGLLAGARARRQAVLRALRLGQRRGSVEQAFRRLAGDKDGSRQPARRLPHRAPVLGLPRELSRWAPRRHHWTPGEQGRLHGESRSSGSTSSRRSRTSSRRPSPSGRFLPDVSAHWSAASAKSSSAPSRK